MEELATGQLLAELGALAAVVGVVWRMIRSVRTDLDAAVRDIRREVDDIDDRLRQQNGRRLEQIEAEIKDREDKHHYLETQVNALELLVKTYIAREGGTTT